MAPGLGLTSAPGAECRSLLGSSLRHQTVATAAPDASCDPLQWVLRNCACTTPAVLRRRTLCPLQYVALPPEMSKTAPVLNEHSSEHSQATSAATSSRRQVRAMGIFDTM